MTTTSLVEHFFRHEYGRLVAVLSGRVGVRHMEAVEDSAQTALMKALESWPRGGEPVNPSAWLFRVAYNDLLDRLRKQKRHRLILDRRASELLEDQDSEALTFCPEEVQDDLLRMLFVCCDEHIPARSQLVLALKTLCGFSVGEIALRLFTSQANVYKRLTRARGRLAEVPDYPADLSSEQYLQRVPQVRKILYLLFTEGHLSSHAEVSIRRELCDEALRLVDVLAHHPVGQTPETSALVALMHLHAARMSARQDASGGLVLLEEQDRELWNVESIHNGLTWLAKSAEGDIFSRYHAEAGIAAEHCLSPSFAETRWDRIAESYAMLEGIAPSPIHTLNRAVALAEWQGPEAGLTLLESFDPPKWLVCSYLWSAVMADLHRRCHNREEAECFREAALDAAPTEAVRVLLERRLQA